MKSSVWYTPAPWRGLRLIAIGGVIAAIGVVLFWFEIPRAIGPVVFLMGFSIVVWGQVVYIRALRAHRESFPTTSAHKPMEKP